MGFVPNSLYTMARVPNLLETFADLADVVLRNDLLPRSLVQMVALVTSAASGCRYCQAHTAHTAERFGVSEEKLADIWSFETSDLFDDKERAALRIGYAGGLTPNAVTEEMFVTAREFFSDEELTSIVAVIALFGFLNRWNDTVATELEAQPTAFGFRVLGSNGWTVGKHAGSSD